MSKPYTPATLAQRWACSDETIRQMIARGDAFPAHAGMTRPQPRARACRAGVPRPRGDDPPGLHDTDRARARSPPTRG